MRKTRPHALMAGWLVLARLVLEEYRWRVAVARARMRRPPWGEGGRA